MKEESSPIAVASASTSAAAAAAAPSPPVVAKPVIRQPTIMEKFGMTTQASSGSSAATNAALADLKQKLEEQRSKTFEALEALKSAHDRAEVAEAESQTIKTLYKKELVGLLRTMGKNEFEEARRELALNSLKYGTVKWERHANQVQEVWHQGTV